MAITSTRTFNQVWAHVREHILPGLQNTWFKGVPLFKKLDKVGSAVLRGGKYIEVPLETGEGPTQEFSGYQALTTIETDPFTGAQAQWATMQVPVLADLTEVNMCQGPQKIADLQRRKLNNAKASLKTAVNKMFYAGLSAKGFQGLQLAVPTDPTAGTYQNINRATDGNPWWRSNQDEVAAAFTYNTNGNVNANTLIDKMSAGVWTCQQNDVESARNMMMLTGPTVMGYLEKVAFRVLSLVESGAPGIHNQMDADLGIVVPFFKGVPILVDETIESYKPGDDAGEGLYILNLKYFKWYRLAGMNFATRSWREFQEQHALFTRIFLGQQLVCTNPRFQMVLWGIDAPGASGV